jgi:hypothetical protein
LRESEHVPRAGTIHHDERVITYDKRRRFYKSPGPFAESADYTAPPA